MMGGGMMDGGMMGYGMIIWTIVGILTDHLTCGGHCEIAAKVTHSSIF